MKILPSLAIGLSCSLLLALAGCESRSISDSGYYHGNTSYGGNYASGGYRGELLEADVVGAPASGGAVSEAEIQRALRNHAAVHAAPGTGLIVVQSGAQTPDADMLRSLGAHYRVQSFSGLLPDEADRANYSKSLRLAAAQGGYQHILCCWGTLESAREDQVTKTVSWVPIAGSFVPDESQRMRINLHAVLIDVATGRWSAYTGKSSENTALSARVVRESSDQKQVAQLKASAYASLADELVARSG